MSLNDSKATFCVILSSDAIFKTTLNNSLLLQTETNSSLLWSMWNGEIFEIYVEASVNVLN